MEWKAAILLSPLGEAFRYGRYSIIYRHEMGHAWRLNAKWQEEAVAPDEYEGHDDWEPCPY